MQTQMEKKKSKKTSNSNKKPNKPHKPNEVLLNRRINIIDTDILGIEDDGVKELVVYPKEKCSYIDSEGKRCRKNAVGEGDTCEEHGGDRVIMNNLIPADSIPEVLKGIKYDPSYHPMEYLMWAQLGLSTVEIAAKFEIPEREIKLWAETYVEFNRAFEIGEALHQAWYLAEGKKNLDNRGYNVELFKFITGNKLGWSTKTESKNLHVTAGVLMVPKTESEDSWEQKYGDGGEVLEGY